MRFFRALGIAVILPLLLPSVTARSEVTLTLLGAIEQGLKNNEQYRSVLAEETRAEQRIKEARADIFPNITFDATYTRAFEIPSFVIAGQEIEFGTRHTTAWGFSVEQSIWQGGRVFAAWSAARNYEDMTEASSRQAGINLQARVTEAYLNAWLARRLVTVAEETLDLAEQNFTVVDRKFQQGLVSEYDHLRAKVRVANLRPSVIEARNRRDLADSQLRKLIGLESSVSLELAESAPDSSAWENRDLEELIAAAQEQRSDLTASQYEINILKDNVRAAKADYWPSLKLRGTFDWQTFGDEFAIREDDITRSWQGMITISYPLFDGFRRSGNVGIAKVDLSQAHLRRQDLAKRVALEVEQARNNFIEATERLEAQEETVGQAQRGLEIANVRYNSGVGTQLEVLDAQVELTTARINAETARHDRLVARAQWRRAMGEPVLNAVTTD